MLSFASLKISMLVLLFTCLTVWVAFRNWFPEAPLSSTESTIVVGFVLLFWSGVVKLYILAKPRLRRLITYLKLKRKSAGPPTNTFLLVHLALLMTMAQVQAQKSKPSVLPDTELVVVRASASVVGSNSIIQLNAYGPAGQGLVTRWSAASGEIQQDSQGTTWVLRNAPEGEHIAVCVWKIGAKSGQALLRIIVASQTEDINFNNAVGSGIYLSRHYLLNDNDEYEGAGLYSYLLLRTRPSAANRDRYRAVVREYLRQVQTVALMSRYAKEKEINVFCLPVNRDKLDNDQEIRSVVTDSYCDKVLDEEYDYARAQFLLGKLQRVRGDGPLIVCTRKPLTKWKAANATSPSSQAFVQDLSNVPPRLITLWVSEFGSLSTQERLWTDNTIGLLPLRMRILIGSMADALPDVQAALGSWASWSVEKKP